MNNSLAVEAETWRRTGLQRWCRAAETWSGRARGGTQCSDGFTVRCLAAPVSIHRRTRYRLRGLGKGELKEGLGGVDVADTEGVSNGKPSVNAAA